MNVLFAIKTLHSVGGAERVLAQIASELADRGHQLTLLTFDAPKIPDFYEIDDRIARLRLDLGRHDAPTSPTAFVRGVTAIRRILRARMPQVAVGFMHSAYVPLAFAAADRRTPVIASEHTAITHFAHRRLELILVRLAARLTSRMTIPSEAVGARFPPLVRDRMVVIPNPVTAPKQLPFDRRDARRATVLAVGRLSSEKRHDVLIDAFAHVADRHPTWSLRIVGEGERRAELERRATELGIRHRVELPGVTSEIETEYQRAEIFAVPSDYESFGIATAEALAAAVPAIGFADCPGTNDLIRHAENGLLVSGADRVEAFAHALDHLMSSPTERRRLAEAAPGSVGNFAIGPIVDRWEQLLLEVAGMTDAEARE